MVGAGGSACPAGDELKVQSLAAVVSQESNLDEGLNVEQNLMVYACFQGRGHRGSPRPAEPLCGAGPARVFEPIGTHGPAKTSQESLRPVKSA